MKIVISLSGGMDSATVLGYYLSKEHQVFPVSFEYGSKHNKYEQKCVFDLCKYYNIDPPVIVNLDFINKLFKSNLLQSGGDIPEGHYEQENMSQTVVPGRNLIFASILAGYAESIEADAIALGVHSGDHAIYHDCRPDFIYALKLVIDKSSNFKIDVLAPFLQTDKTGILQIGYNLGDKFKVPYELTRTCYKDQELSCGKCGSCIERLEAFELIGKIDPIKYEN